MSYGETIHRILLTGSPINPGLPEPLATFVVAQTAYESAEDDKPYNSNVFWTDNNTVGYKFVNSRYQVRPGIRSPEGDYYGHYASLQDNIFELIDWIYRRRNEGKFPDLRRIKTPEQYATLLKATGYYGITADKYTAGLKRWLGNYTVPIGAGGILILGIAAVLIYNRMKKTSNAK